MAEPAAKQHQLMIDPHPILQEALMLRLERRGIRLIRTADGLTVRKPQGESLSQGERQVIQDYKRQLRGMLNPDDSQLMLRLRMDCAVMAGQVPSRFEGTQLGDAVKQAFEDAERGAEEGNAMLLWCARRRLHQAVQRVDNAPAGGEQEAML